jgi:hypothetical protein
MMLSEGIAAESMTHSDGSKKHEAFRTYGSRKHEATRSSKVNEFSHLKPCQKRQ